MTTAFQPSAFQADAFQIETACAFDGAFFDPAVFDTCAPTHVHVGGGIAFRGSKGWHGYQFVPMPEWDVERLRLEAEAEREKQAAAAQAQFLAIVKLAAARQRALLVADERDLMEVI